MSREDTFTPEPGSSPDQLARAERLLYELNAFVEPVIKPFNQARLIIEDKFNNRPPDDTQGHELPNRETREVYRNLLTACPQVVKLLFDRPEWDDSIFNNPVFRAFAYGFNKLKQQKDDRVVMRTRLKDVPYAVHTSVEVVFFMDKLGVGRTDLAKALAILHDVTEEGSRIVAQSPGSESAAQGVKPENISNSVPEMGKLLAVGVPVLTETDYNHLLEEPGMEERIQAFRDTPKVSEIIGKAKETFGTMSPERIDRHYEENPFVFGQLAQQIPVAVDKTLQLSQGHKDAEQLQDLAASIIEVEIGDRMADMTYLERLIVNRKSVDLGGDSPAYARQRILLYASRMLNMRDKLYQATDMLKKNSSTNRANGITEALTKYTAFLEMKLEDVNRAMREKEEYTGIKAIYYPELIDFYRSTFRPLQDAAEIQLQPFVEGKVSKILNAAGFTNIQ